MSWISKLVKPTLRQLFPAEQRDVPENLWISCPSCSSMIFHKDLRENLYVCNKCEYHMAMPIKERIASLYDSEYTTYTTPIYVKDPLAFKDGKEKYSDKLEKAQKKTKTPDALVVTKGRIATIETVMAVFNFAFMGGSMGTAVGEALVYAAQKAIEEKTPLVVITASGGARMHEGILSLMQMARTTVAINQVKEARLPFVVIHTNPTTGGVTASFAMIGDIHIAEKGAIIGFAGARVIEQTIRQKLPEGFQRAEYLHEHGMVDTVVHRQDLKNTIGTILQLFINRVI